MRTDKVSKKAISNGRIKAREAVAKRDTQLKKRNRIAKRSVSTMSQVLPDELIGDSGIISSGVPLLAEGDSWFDYPFCDVLKALDDDHGFDVEHVANAGDSINEMAYEPAHLESFSRSLEKMIRRNQIPKAILLSGGGNDVAGKQFSVFLNHASSPHPGLNDVIVREMIDGRMRLGYLTLLSSITEICRRRLGFEVPIIIHGYDYPVPDGRGFLFWGPWLEPGFEEKGYTDLIQKKNIIAQLIDRMNQMLEQVINYTEMQHVILLDLRTTLPNDKRYKKWWANEMHPTSRGFKLVAQRFADAIDW